MIDTQKILHEQILADSSLLALLGSNRPYWDKAINPNQQYSIFPAGLAPMTAVCPFITVQGGVITKQDKHTISETYYLRVYNSKEQSYMKINEIAEKLISLFDEKIFALDNHTMIRSKYDSTLQEATDEGMRLNFREVRFRIVLI